MLSILIAAWASLTTHSDGRMAIPDRATQEASRRKIREGNVCEQRIEGLGLGDQRDTPSGRARLARDLCRLAKETKESPDRYVLYLEALDEAGKSGSMRVADEIVLDLTREFQLDRWLQILGLQKKIDPDYSWQEADNVERLIAWTDAALADGAMDAAEDLAEAAKRSAGKAEHPPLAELASTRYANVKALVRDLRAASKALSEDAGTPGANRVVGAFECAYRANWAVGLELLEKSGDERLTSASKLERRQPTDSSGWHAVGEAWVAAADAEKSARNAAAFRRHAAECFERGRAQLSGLQNELAVKRISDLLRLADETERELNGKPLDDQLSVWKVGAKVEGTRALAGAAPRLVGEIVRSDDRWLEIALVETWTQDGVTHSPKYTWRFERVDQDLRTGRVTYTVRDSAPLNRRRNYSGEVAIRGRTMAGYYSFEFPSKDAKDAKDYTLGGPLDWVLTVK